MNKYKNPLKNRRGDALVVVLCIIALLMALSLAMLIAASALTGSAKNSAMYDRCRVMAQSFDELIGNEKYVDEKGYLVKNVWSDVPNGGSFQSGSEKLTSLAMRSLRAFFEGSSGSADGMIPLNDEAVKATDRVTMIYDVAVDFGGSNTTISYEGYALSVELYLVGNISDINKQIEDIKLAHTDPRYVGIYITDAYRNVQFMTKVICTGPDGKSFSIKTCYKPEITIDPGEEGEDPEIKPVYYWKWIKEWSE